jgi:hypothetical protein
MKINSTARKTNGGYGLPAGSTAFSCKNFCNLDYQQDWNI